MIKIIFYFSYLDAMLLTFLTLYIDTVVLIFNNKIEIHSKLKEINHIREIKIFHIQVCFAFKCY